MPQYIIHIHFTLSINLHSDGYCVCKVEDINPQNSLFICHNPQNSLVVCQIEKIARVNRAANIAYL